EGGSEVGGGNKGEWGVNRVGGGEGRFAAARPPQGERIAVIGAGPAGLTYASLVADGNTVTVFERENTPGGAFRYTGRAPQFQEVVAEQDSFDNYIEHMVAACMYKGAIFLYGVDVIRTPEPLAT